MNDSTHKKRICAKARSECMLVRSGELFRCHELSLSTVIGIVYGRRNVIYLNAALKNDYTLHLFRGANAQSAAGASGFPIRDLAINTRSKRNYCSESVRGKFLSR